MRIDELYQESAVITGGICWNHSTEQRFENEKCLEQYGYKVYSQNDEDGIIQEIFKRIGTTSKTFVEFGVQDGLESNCHYLLFKGWKGVWLEGNPQYVKVIKKKFNPSIQAGQLKCECAFITRDNINEILSGQLSFLQTQEIDLLSIDVDGNDYDIWENIQAIHPRVVIIEYNGKFPPDCTWKMAYNERHIWDGSDWHGASLKALELLGEKLGYQLVGTNLTGVNAFFVKNDLVKGKFYEPATAEELYNPLRLNIRHMNGHPARYCLNQQVEGIGLFNYEPDAIAIPGQGFYSMEENGETKFCWMSDARSIIYVRNSRKADKLKIPVFIVREFFENQDDYYVDVLVNHALQQKNIMKDNEMVLEVAIPESEDIIEVELVVPFLWKPSDVIGSGDERKLGIAVRFGRICLKV